MIVNKADFHIILNSINSCYAESVKNKLPKIDDFPEEIFVNNKVDIYSLAPLINDTSNLYLKSVIRRIIALSEIRKNRNEDKKLNISKIWHLISDSLLNLPAEATISSIGSQGFLSIPLFKYDERKENFDFIRLHIWDKSLETHYDKEKCNKFSIHTHSFFAESWIICGKVINNRFRISEAKESQYSLFTVGYNKSLNEINQHTSSANNTGVFVNVEKQADEIHESEGYYNIEAGDFHQSGSKGNKNGLSATFFSFTAQKGLVPESYVVGPSEINSSEINRKVNIDPTVLLQKINDTIKKDE